MNLEKYLSATLPTAVIAKIFEDNNNNNEVDDNKKTDNDEDNETTSASAKRQKLEITIEEHHQSETTPSSSIDTPATTGDGEEDSEDDDDDGIEFNEKNLLIMLMQNFNAENPREVLSRMIPSYVQIPDSFDNSDISRLIYQMVSSEENIITRKRLEHINTIDDAVNLIKKSNNIMILTGAGCSVSCGIPDFRSRNGIYARLHKDYPDLPDPQSMFDIIYFQHNPHPFFKFAKEIYPGQFKPSLSHLFIKKIEENKKLLRNYTQNIDTIELIAGIKNIIQCHGSFATATCTNQECKYKCNADDIRDSIFNQEIPKCKECNQVGILKPDIVFFGESLPESYHKAILEDKDKCDLLIVIGSSLKVKPVAHIPQMLNEDVPQILINRESLNHMNFDIELLGDCDVIVKELLLRLNDDEWTNLNEDFSLKNSENKKLELIDDEKIVHELILECERNFLENTADLEKTFLSSVLKKDTFIHIKPNIYVFQGSEIKYTAARKQLFSESESSSEESSMSSDISNGSDISSDNNESSSSSNNSLNNNTEETPKS